MPNLNDATTTDLMSAWGAIIGGGATAIAATAGVAAAVAAIRTLRATKRDSRDRSRPMVGALLSRDDHPHSRVAYLLVRNYGGTVAYNVHVTFDPEIRNLGTQTGANSLVPFLLGRYEKPISTMMPGVELSNVWFAPGNRDGTGNVLNDEPIPDMVTATIRYSDRADFWGKRTNRYADTFALDLSIIRLSVTSTHTDDHLGLHKRSTKALEKMAPAIEQVAKDIHRIEDYVKPELVREQQAIQSAADARAVEEMLDQVLPNRHKSSTDDE